MSPQWSRRALLASLGTAALAGCAAGENDDREPSPTRQPPPVPSPRGEPDSPAELDSAWPTPGAEPGRSNYVAGATGPTEQVAPLWTSEVPMATTDPVVAGGTLFVGAGDAVHALNARTGDERWRQSIGATAGRPWVVGDVVFVPTDVGVVALAAADGSERWHTAMPSLVDGGFFATSHGAYALTRAGEPTVVALDADGSERWRTAIADPWSAHLFASDDTVFVSSGGSGVRPWQLAADTGDVVGDPPTPVTDSPDPRFYRDGTVVSRDFLPAAVDARPAGDDGYEWRERISVAGLGPLSSDDDRVYCLASGDSVAPRGDDPDDEPGLYALSLTDGSRLWSTTDLDAASAGRPVVTDDTVLVSTDNALYCLDPTDGSERWATSIYETSGTIVAVDDIIYTTIAGVIRAFRPPR